MVSRFHRAIAVITIVASAVFLLCIMLLKVEERRLDAAVMRFVGVRRRTIFGALLLEAALVAAFGSVAGSGLAYLAGAATNAYYQTILRHWSHVLPDHPEDRSLQRRLVPGPGHLGRGSGGLAPGSHPPLVLWGRG